MMSREIAPDDYRFMMELLRRWLGHDLGEGKEYLLQSRLAPVATAFGAGSVAALIDRLRRSSDGAIREAVLDAMVTSETSFFRTPRTYESLRQTVLPALIAARLTSRRLRLWCAACSTGQEPYSIAITLNEGFPELRTWSIDLLATDTSERLLHRAREGKYSQAEVQRGLPEPLLRKYFHPAGSSWKVNPDLRRSVRFQRLNLIHAFRELGGTFDIIFMRNVLIYLDTEHKSYILGRLRDVIEPDGYLFLGESETILGLTDHFRLSGSDEPFYRPARANDS